MSSPTEEPSEDPVPKNDSNQDDESSPTLPIVDAYANDEDKGNGVWSNPVLSPEEKNKTEQDTDSVNRDEEFINDEPKDADGGENSTDEATGEETSGEVNEAETAEEGAEVDQEKTKETATEEAVKEQEDDTDKEGDFDDDGDHNNNNDDDGEDDESDAEGPVNKKQKTTSSSPPRPIKRARTAYFIFTDEKRPQVQAEHPGEGVAVVARIMGQMWSNLSSEEKESYQQKAALERDRVAKELEEWKAAGGVLEEEIHGEGSGSGKEGSLVYPLGRIRKICKLDPEVRGVSKEALLLITKCAELATAKLGQESVRVAQLQNRRKLLPEDVAHVCSHREQFLFLKDDVKDLVKDMVSKQEPKVSATAKKGDTAREVAAAGSKPLTSYFATRN